VGYVSNLPNEPREKKTRRRQATAITYGEKVKAPPCCQQVAARNITLLLCKLQHLHFAITIAGDEARRARTSSRRQEATMVHLPGVIIDASFNGEAAASDLPSSLSLSGC
jgi:hypothetical protein